MVQNSNYFCIFVSRLEKELKLKDNGNIFSRCRPCCLHLSYYRVAAPCSDKMGILFGHESLVAVARWWHCLLCLGIVCSQYILVGTARRYGRIAALGHR